MEITAWRWLADSPREALESQTTAPMTPGMAALASFSALFSAALAEAVLVPGAGKDLALGVGCYGAAYLALVWVLQQISRLFGRSASLASWFRASTIVILPLHLLLPAALLCARFGAAGLVVYELSKLVIASAMVRRGTWAVEALLHWPPWAALALAASPFLVGALGLVLMTSFAVLLAAATIVSLFS